ncbi:MAG: hypothetical protein HIU92_09200 [Proteobacteria bacterium]|nr:hypothetical protein [Pseudomonadota bacterium]
MQKILLAGFALLAMSGPALAAGPTSLGVFSDWTAAEYGTGAGRVCYAFTRAIGSDKTPSAAMIIVSERPTARDEVVVNATAPYPPKTEVAVQIDNQPPMSFYTAARSAFSRDGKAAVIGMQKGADATATWDRKGGKQTEKFSLSGFSAAYGAIVKGCPAK